MLISAKSLLRGTQQDLCGHIACHECPFLVSDGHDSTECALERFILSQPAVDSVPVVRCKDCRFWKESSGLMVCELMIWKSKGFVRLTCTGNWFCADGKRREDGQTD